MGIADKRVATCSDIPLSRRMSPLRSDPTRGNSRDGGLKIEAEGKGPFAPPIDVTTVTTHRHMVPTPFEHISRFFFIPSRPKLAT